MNAKDLKPGQFFWYIGKVCQCRGVDESCATVRFGHYVRGKYLENMIGFRAQVEPLQFSSWMEVGPLTDEPYSQTCLSKTNVLANALSVLSVDIQSDDGVANAAIFEASLRLRDLDAAVKQLHELLHRTQSEFVSNSDRACFANRDALVKHEWLTKL